VSNNNNAFVDSRLRSRHANHDEQDHLLVFIAEQNSVGIDAVVLALRDILSFHLGTCNDTRASLSINIASASANGVDLSPIPSVGRSVCLLVCPESVLWQNG